MNVCELLERLKEERVPSHWFSINDDLSSDIYVLRNVHDYWECFYVDERGNQNNGYKRFNSESDACEYLLKKLLYEKNMSSI